MPGGNRRGLLWSDPRVKPPFGSVEIDGGHALTGDDLSILILGNEGAGSPHDLVHRRALVKTGTPGWGVNHGGLEIDFPTTGTGNYYTIGTEGSGLTLPTDAGTAFLIRRKKDTDIASAAGSFGSVSNQNFGVMLPYVTGNILWDMSGFRLSVAFTPTTNLEVWTFTASAAGMAIYLNGTVLGSNATNAIRSATTSDYRLHDNEGSGVSGGYAEEIVLFGVVNRAWSSAEALDFYAEPYAFLRPIIRRRYFVPAAAGGIPTLVGPRFGLAGRRGLAA